MNRIIITTVFILLITVIVNAQDKKIRAVDNFVDFTAGIGKSQGTMALGYVYNWKLGKRKKLEMGLGVRFTSYFGNDLYFKTAPAKLTSGKTGPAVLFAEDINQNIDSVFFPKTQINSLNLSLNFAYNFTEKFSAGLTIDAIGFSFGKKQSGVYYGNNAAPGVPVMAKPTGFNLLLISDNDKGSLNSELFARYKWNDSWGVKLGFQFYFAEYTTDTEIQKIPGGDTNDRFRKKMAGVGIGVSYNLKTKK